MENKLRKLFDYQRFEGNGRLERLISETENRYANTLSDDDLTFVNAAGDLTAGSEKDGKNNDTKYVGGLVGVNGRTKFPSPELPDEGKDPTLYIQNGDDWQK